MLWKLGTLIAADLQKKGKLILQCFSVWAKIYIFFSLFWNCAPIKCIIFVIKYNLIIKNVLLPSNGATLHYLKKLALISSIILVSLIFVSITNICNFKTFKF